MTLDYDVDYFRPIDRFILVLSDEQIQEIVITPDRNRVDQISIKACRKKHPLMGDLHHYFNGAKTDFSQYQVNLDKLSAFQQSVLRETKDISYGETVTYTELAGRIDKPSAARAVGNALRRIPFPIVVPCHRVVAKNGLGGFSCGLEVKKKLLELESQLSMASD